MNAGYGRGYYGEGQLARAPRKRSWFTIVAVLGVGATVVWLLWPNKAVPNFGSVGKGTQVPTSPPPGQTTSPLVVINNTTSPPASAPLANAPLASVPLAVPAPFGAMLKQLEDEAHARGFIEVKDYEDSVLLTAKQLQSTGAKVVLAPHLQHLAPQLES